MPSRAGLVSHLYFAGDVIHTEGVLRNSSDSDKFAYMSGLRQRGQHQASTAPEIPISPLQDTSPSASAAGQEDPPLAFLFDGDVSVEADLRCGIF